MVYKITKKHFDRVFELAIDHSRGSAKDEARAHNLHIFSTQLGYLDAALMGGKLTHKQASRQAKDLYKAWKDANKTIDME